MITAVSSAAARTSSRIRSARSGGALRIVGIVLGGLSALWAIVGLLLFAQASGGAASALLALDPAATDTALAILGWPGQVVFTVVVTTQAAVLVTTIVAAGFILATPRPSLFTTMLAVTMVLFVATGTCAVIGWTSALPQTESFTYSLTALASIAFLGLAPLFPTGTAVPRWSAAIPASWCVLGAVSLVVPWWTLGEGWVFAGSATAILLVAATIVAQVLRYRRHSDRTQRQQMKWVLLAISLYLASLVPVFATPPGALDAMDGPVGVALQLVRGVIAAVLFALIAVSIAFAIAKYRLFDVDLVIRRAIVAGALVIAVGALYLVVVGGAALLWQGSGPFAAIAATIAVAFAAHPVRVRLERAVSRWVYGDRGDPYAVVSRLSDALRDLTGSRAIADHVADVVVNDLRYSGATVKLHGAGGTHESTRGDESARIVARQALAHDGEQFGELLVRADAGDRLSAAHARLVDAVAAQAALALGAARASDELRASRDRILAAREEERLRLYRDLHDGLGPGLAGARQRVETAVALGDAQPEAGRRLLLDASDAMRDMLADVRALVQGLRPPALEELGLSEAVRQAARPLSSAPDAAAVDVGPAPGDLPPAVEVAAYRIAVEALTNALRHARADSIRVAFDASPTRLTVTIDDDGDGMPDSPAGGGSRSMRDRAHELGGRVRTTSRRPRGTRVRAELPLLLGEGATR